MSGFDDDDDVAEELRAEVEAAIGDKSRDDSGPSSGASSARQDDGDTTALRAQRLAEKAAAKDARRAEKKVARNERKAARSNKNANKNRPSGRKAAVVPVETEKSSKPTTKAANGKKRVVISDDSVAEQRDRRVSVVGESKFRQRRIDVNRSEGRRRLRVFVIIGVVVAVVAAVLLLLASPILSIRTVNVEGNVYTDPDVLATVVDDLKGEAILTADLHRAEVILLAIPWVEDARVSMRLPSTVNIEIREREPVAFFRAVDGFNRVIDHQGRVLDVIEGDPVAYPLISGTGPSTASGQTVDQPFLGAAQLIDSLPIDLGDRLESAAVTPEGDVSLLLSGGVTVLFGRPDDFQTKLVGVINEIKRQGSSPYSIIDVSSGEPSVR